MKQCHGFLHSWQDTQLVPCTDFLKMKSLDTTCFNTAWDNKLVSHQWYFSSYIYQTQSSVTYQMPTLCSNEHVISRSHPDNLVCGWIPLDPFKKWLKWPRLSGSSDPLSTLTCTLKWPIKLCGFRSHLSITTNHIINSKWNYAALELTRMHGNELIWQ